MKCTQEDHDAVAAAIHSAERRTSGQLVCVFARASSAYAHIPILWASVIPVATGRLPHCGARGFLDALVASACAEASATRSRSSRCA